MIFLISIIFFFLFSFHLTSYYDTFRKPLEAIYQEIYVQKKANPYQILVKNFCIAGLDSLKKMFYLNLFGWGFAIVFIPSILVGYLIYTHLDLFFVPDVATSISLMPLIGEPLQDMVAFLYESAGREIALGLQSIPLAFQSIILFLPILFIIAVSDLIQATIQRRQRGNIRSILKRGLIFTVFNLKLSRKDC